MVHQGLAAKNTKTTGGRNLSRDRQPSSDTLDNERILSIEQIESLMTIWRGTLQSAIKNSCAFTTGDYSALVL